MKHAFGEIPSEVQRLNKRLMLTKYRSIESKEFALHGLLRRVDVIQRCITNVFGLISPFESNRPSDEQRDDALINLHAHVFNVFGAMHNLAWIWVIEKNVRDKKGKSIPVNHVGLSINHKDVFESLPDAVKTHVHNISGWSENIESFRHSLAHQVPFYIPPYIIQQHDADQYNKLEQLKADSVGKGDLDSYFAYMEKQDSLGQFVPVFAQSPSKSSKMMYFHANMISDIRTVFSTTHIIFDHL